MRRIEETDFLSNKNLRIKKEIQAQIASKKGYVPKLAKYVYLLMPFKGWKVIRKAKTIKEYV